MPKPFKKGSGKDKDPRIAPGGARVGAGRKPDEFKAWLTRLVHHPKARKRFEKILNDEQDAETLVTSEGVEVPVRAKGATYLQALELALSYDQGKPQQSVDMKIEDVGERPHKDRVESALARLRDTLSRAGMVTPE